jgi:hypothetical protein
LNGKILQQKEDKKAQQIIKIEVFLAQSQPISFQPVTQPLHKRCLIRLQKGVSKTSKGHLLQVN